MPLPHFATLAGDVVVTFSRGDLFPAQVTVTPRQRIGISQSGTVHTATLSVPDERHVLAFDGLTAAAVRAFLQDTVNWAQAPFVYQDVAGVARTVRYVEGTFVMPETSAGSYSLQLTLRVEIPWEG